MDARDTQYATVDRDADTAAGVGRVAARRRGRVRRQRDRVQVLRPRRDARPDRRARPVCPGIRAATARLCARHIRRVQHPVPGTQQHAASVLQHDTGPATVPPAGRVHASLTVGLAVQFRAVHQRFAVGPSVAQYTGGLGTVLPGPQRCTRVPARRAEQDEKMLRPRGRVQ